MSPKQTFVPWWAVGDRVHEVDDVDEQGTIIQLNDTYAEALVQWDAQDKPRWIVWRRIRPIGTKATDELPKDGEA